MVRITDDCISSLLEYGTRQITKCNNRLGLLGIGLIAMCVANVSIQKRLTTLEHNYEKLKGEI